MKNLFVPYELALKLKEKGFNEQCLMVYESKDSLIPESEAGSNYTNVDAPLYQQVQNWFYNRHKIFVEADGYIINSGKYDGCYGFKAVIRVAEDYKEKILFAQGEFSTIERAWDKAIEEAIKLI